MSTFVFSHLSIYPVPVSRTQIPRRVRQSLRLRSLATISMSVHPLWPAGRRKHTQGQEYSRGNSELSLGKPALSRAVEDKQRFARHSEDSTMIQNRQAKRGGARNHSEWWEAKDKAGGGGRSGQTPSRAKEAQLRPLVYLPREKNLYTAQRPSSSTY